MREDFLHQFYKKNTKRPGFKLLKNADIETFKKYRQILDNDSERRRVVKNTHELKYGFNDFEISDQENGGRDRVVRIP